MADFDILRRKGIKIILMETCEQNIKIKYVRLVISFTLNPRVQEENTKIDWKIIKPLKIQTGILMFTHGETNVEMTWYE